MSVATLTPVDAMIRKVLRNHGSVPRILVDQHTFDELLVKQVECQHVHWNPVWRWCIDCGITQYRLMVSRGPSIRTVLMQAGLRIGDRDVIQGSRDEIILEALKPNGFGILSNDD